MRIKHDKYGHGIIAEEFISYGGANVARCVFDARPDEERIILRSVLSESTAAMPELAKAVKPARKPRKKKTDIPDELLVDMTPKIGIQLDALPDELADRDELPNELNQPEVDLARNESFA